MTKIEHLDPFPTGVPHGGGPIDVVGIGASLGGPVALRSVLSGLPKDLPVPVAVCQHMAPGFTEHFAEQLDKVTRLRVKEARHAEPALPGTVYLAPAGLQMRVVKKDGKAHIRLDRDWADSLHVPSIDILFGSLARDFGSCAMAVLLTGMGDDGAQGMYAVRRAGGHTVCESEDTAVSFGMPGSAIGLRAAAVTLPVELIADHIAQRVASVR